MKNVSETPQRYNRFISIIVPIYNDGEYLADCLDSILHQTSDKWECILVDDCSADNSVQIAEKYCADDTRFRLIRNEKNSSAWTCRAKGITAAAGGCIMFADADDSMVPDAVECVLNEMELKPCDILHFGTNVINRYGLKVHQMAEYSDYLSPGVGELSGSEVFSSFVSRKFEGHLWNKAFDGRLLKKVVGDLGTDMFLPKAQDKVLYWAVCLSKKDLTYRGIKKKLYNYNYGFGVENGKRPLSCEDIIPFLTQAWSENEIADLTSRYCSDLSGTAEILEKSRYSLIRHSLSKIVQLPADKIAQGLVFSLDYWDKPMDKAMAVCALAEYSWDRIPETARSLIPLKALKPTCEDTPKVIGTYYECMNNGGIQRVISGLVKLWHDQGYDVVLFTDDEPSADDYPLPEYVKRVVLSRRHDRCSALSYRERGMSWAKNIHASGIDVMVYHAYFSPVLLYDELICKLMGIPFVLYQHNSFSRYLLNSDSRFSSISFCSAISDHVVCLSETDKAWWECLNVNSSVVLDPLTFGLDDTPCAPRKNHDILFVGRLCEEAKRPTHAVEIAAKVIDKFPDARLIIVGSTGDKAYMSALQARIEGAGIADNVKLCGFQKDVSEYYRCSSVFLSCSSYEGFMLTLCEAMAYSLPVVMYSLPYLAAANKNGGIIAVPQEDTDAAAEAICALFSDESYLRSVGNEGRKRLGEMYSVDIGGQWDKIFKSIKKQAKEPVPERFEMAVKLADDHLAAVHKMSHAELSIFRKALKYYKKYGFSLTIKRTIEKIKKG